MRYDHGYGRHDGWEYQVPDAARGYDRGYRNASAGHGGERPWVGGYREGYQGGSGGYAVGTSGPVYEGYAASDRGPREGHERGYRRPRGAPGRGERLGAGGQPGPGDGFADDARPGFGTLGHLDQGGGYDGGHRGQGGYDQGGGYDRGYRGTGGYDRGYGRDTGRGGMGGVQGGGYDAEFGQRRRFQNEGRPEDYRPRYSPVGGTYAPMGGSYLNHETPGPLRDPRWTSERTRWF